MIFNGWLTGGLNVWWWTIYDNMMGCSARDHIGSSPNVDAMGWWMMMDAGVIMGLLYWDCWLDCNPTCRYSSWLGQAVDPLFFFNLSTGNKQSKWNASTKNQHPTPIKLPRTWLAFAGSPCPWAGRMSCWRKSWKSCAESSFTLHVMWRTLPRPGRGLSCFYAVFGWLLKRFDELPTFSWSPEQLGKNRKQQNRSWFHAGRAVTVASTRRAGGRRAAKTLGGSCRSDIGERIKDTKNEVQDMSGTNFLSIIATNRCNYIGALYGFTFFSNKSGDHQNFI